VNTAVEVMTALASHDAQVVVDGGRIRLLFSAGHPPPEALIEAARFHKHALRTILESRRETRPSGPYGQLLAALQSKCPELVEPNHWQQAIRDADSFLQQWGAQADWLGWTARELFGLHPVPERPSPSYRRLSRYDETGLVWLLRGRAVVALTATEAVMRCPSGSTLMYRRQNKPAPEPLGDSINDIWGGKDRPLAHEAAA
jgi:hypothetical protein